MVHLYAATVSREAGKASIQSRVCSCNPQRVLHVSSLARHEMGTLQLAHCVSALRGVQCDLYSHETADQCTELMPGMRSRTGMLALLDTAVGSVSAAGADPSSTMPSL